MNLGFLSADIHRILRIVIILNPDLAKAEKQLYLAVWSAVDVELDVLSHVSTNQGE